MIGRTIPHAHTLESNELYVTSNKANVLQDVTMAEMNGLLRQIAQLGTCAADIFQGILKMTNDVTERMDSASNKIENLQSSVPEVESMFRCGNNISNFYSNQEERITHTGRDMQEGLFTPMTRDRTLIAQYNQCNDIPNFTDLDSLRTETSQLLEGQSCGRAYSNPSYFVEHWLITENRKLAIQKAEASAAKERRKEARKNKKKQTKKVSITGVAALNVKQYSALGAEFADMNGTTTNATTNNASSNRLSRRSNRIPAGSSRTSMTTTSSNVTMSNTTAATATTAGTTTGMLLPPTTTTDDIPAAPVDYYSEPPPLLPAMTAITELDEEAYYSSMDSHVAMLPPSTMTATTTATNGVGMSIPPPPPAANIPPPPPSFTTTTITDTTTVLTPPPRGPNPVMGNSSLLTAIRNTDKKVLKKVSSSTTSPPPKQQNSIFDGITGFQKGGLKKVSTTAYTTKKSSTAGTSSLHGVAAILSRRMAIQGEGEGESSDDDDGWSDDEY